MNEAAEKIQLVLNTLETVMIPATYDNMNRLMGVYNTLAEVRDGLKKPAETTEAEENG